MKYPIRRLISMTIALMLLVWGCGGGPGGDGGTDLDAGDVDSGFTPPPGSCADDGDCEVGQVCHPFALMCVAPGTTCTSHAECVDATYCETAAGTCLAGTTGSPCETDANCQGVCTGGVCGCDGVAHERELMSGPLDIYFVLDRTGSMGTDCDYVAGTTPPTASKACFATYALSDYLTTLAPIVDTRLAFQWMSQPDDCDGAPYETALVDLTPLPVTVDHALITEISVESFGGGFGTHIEGALRGIAGFTTANETPGREMIGVLMTDGDPNGCEEGLTALRTIIADHYAATGIRTYIIGMEGATEANLEELALAGGADPHDDWCGGIGPPCHYWNVGNGSGDAIASALAAIIRMSVPLPCELDVIGLEPPPGETLDYGRVNVTLTEAGVTTTIGQVPDEASCPTDRPAWYYDDPGAPTQILLCPSACDIVGGAGVGARVDIVVGCQETVVII